MRLFREENYKIIIDPEAKVIREFRRIIERDSSPKKEVAFAELSYVYFMTDYRSPYMIYDGAKRVSMVRKECNLDVEWKQDKLVTEAIAKYEELQQTPAIRSLKAIRDSLITSEKVINALKNNIDNILESEEAAENMEYVVKLVDNLLTLSKKLPEAITSIEQLEEKVKKDKTRDTVVREEDK